MPAWQGASEAQEVPSDPRHVSTLGTFGRHIFEGGPDVSKSAACSQPSTPSPQIEYLHDAVNVLGKMRPLAAALTVLALVLPSARAVVTSDYVFGWKNLMYKDMWCEEVRATSLRPTVRRRHGAWASGGKTENLPLSALQLSLTRVTATSGDWSAILERLGGCNSWLDEDPSSHTLFIPAGRYRFSRDTTICKPIQAQDGVVFVVGG